MTREDEARELLAVTQADRDAAADIFDHYAPNYAVICRSGSELCDRLAVVQTLARHRLAATRPSSPASGEVEQGLRCLMQGAQTTPEDALALLREHKPVLEKALAALTVPARPEAGEDFQARVQPWMMACFGEQISGDMVERGDRLLEEVLELLQSGGYDFGRVVPLRDYVVGRPAGEPYQEVGGVMVTLAAYCLAAGLDMHAAGETELARIWTKVEQIRAKQAAKPRHSPLPQAASLPTARAGIGEDAVEGALRIFNGGIVRVGVAESENPRGYIDYYRPKEAMRAALASLQSSGQDAGGEA